MVRRYYWHEIWHDTENDFLSWCKQQGLPLLDVDGNSLIREHIGRHCDVYDKIRRRVVDRWIEAHKAQPKYEFSRTSDTEFISSYEVQIENVEACYLAHQKGRALVMPIDSQNPSSAVPVEEFVTQHLRDDGYEVMICESRPFHALYGSLMWSWVQDPLDPELQLAGLGGRDDVDTDEHGFVWTSLPRDFGSTSHANRRRKELELHLGSLPDDTGMLIQTYDQWQDSSCRLRQYLWAYAHEDQQRARVLIKILGARRIKAILGCMAEHYWGRYLGWPDLVSWKEVANSSQNVTFTEVKSSGDKLSDEQRSWIKMNHDELRLSFQILKVHRSRRYPD